MCPTQVEPCLHCVGIVRQVRGRCTDSVSHTSGTLFTLCGHCEAGAREVH